MFKQEILPIFRPFYKLAMHRTQEAHIQLDIILLHGEFALFTVRSNFWYQIYQNKRHKILCQLMALIT